MASSQVISKWRAFSAFLRPLTVYRSLTGLSVSPERWYTDPGEMPLVRTAAALVTTLGPAGAPGSDVHPARLHVATRWTTIAPSGIHVLRVFRRGSREGRLRFGWQENTT